MNRHLRRAMPNLYPPADDIAIRMQWAAENAFETTILSVGFLINNFRKATRVRRKETRGKTRRVFLGSLTVDGTN